MKKNRIDFPIAMEGFPFIAFASLVTIVLAAFSFMPLAIASFLMTAFIVYFFRNPERTVPGDPSAMVAPADGKIVFVGNAHERHLNAEMLKVSIFMSVFNVHVNRAPFGGKVFDTFYKHGKFLDARDENATFENEQSGVVLELEKGLKIVFVQVAGLIARRIVSYPVKGDCLVRGERYGLIRFGSRVDIYLPKDIRVNVKLGDKTVAGETILGYLR